MVRGCLKNRRAGRASAVALGAVALAALSVPSALLAQDSGTGLTEGVPTSGTTEPQEAPPPADSQAAPPETPTPPPTSDPAGPNPPNGEAPAPPPTPPATAAGAGGVTMADFSFSPTTITISAGDTVTWTNAGPDEAHTATGDGFDTGTVSVGASGSATFGSAGNFPYVCSLHPDLMSGTVVVEAAAGGGGGSGTEGSDPSTSEGSEAAAIAAPDAAGTASKLPSTGFFALPLALVGFGLVVGGRTLRRRVAR